MKSSGQIVKNKELRTTISRYYDFEQKKVAQSIKDIENVFLRIIQSENAIRSNLISANIGTKENAFLKIKNPRDPNFLELLNTELISFTDNNSTGIVRISDFKYFNSQLISSIEAELEKSRLKKHIKAKN